MGGFRVVPVIGCALLILLAGCAGTPQPQDTTYQRTTSQEHAYKAITDILDASSHVDQVLINDTYVMERGCFDPPRAKAVIRTGFHYENREDSREAVGGKLYRVSMNVTEESVTAIEEIDSVPAPSTSC